MDTREAILNRRSVRKFSDEKIKEELILQLVEAGYNAPSACNRKPFCMYVVTNEEKLNELNKSGKFTNMPSPLAIVVCGDLNKALPLSFSEYWVQDASAVTENILIMATSLGLSTCWNGVYPQKNVVKKIQDILNLDEKIIPLALIHIGYGLEEKKPNNGFDNNVVFFIK